MVCIKEAASTHLPHTNELNGTVLCKHLIYKWQKYKTGNRHSYYIRVFQLSELTTLDMGV